MIKPEEFLIMLKSTLLLFITTAAAVITAAEPRSNVWDFEGDTLPAGIKMWGGTSAELSTDWAADGKQSLKITMSKKDSGLTFVCQETDWNKYSELHLTLYSPKVWSQPSSRSIYIGGKPLDANSVPRYGAMRIPSKGSQKIIVKLDKLPATIDRSKVKSFIIYKGTAGVTFYVDEVKLCTPEEAAQEKLKAEQAKGSIVTGLDFEKDESLSRVKAGSGAVVELAKGNGVGGSRALKAYFPKKDSLISIKPDVSDWRPYKELRFTVYNPQPAPHTKMRVLYINNVELNGKSKPAWGVISVPPESAKEFRVVLDRLPKKIDLSNIKIIHFYKGNPDTTFYIDNIKLYTQEDIDKLEKKKQQQAVSVPLGAVNKALQQPCGAALGKRLEELKTALEEIGRNVPAVFSRRQEDTIRRAGETAALALAVAQRNGAGQTLLLGGSHAAEKIFRDVPLPPLADKTAISAAGNEAESFQIIALPVKRAEKVSVTALPLKHADGSTLLAAKNIQINPVGYVEVLKSFYFDSSRTGFWPDILLDNQVLTLENCIQSYYVTVRVPAGQKPGLYTGAISFAGENFTPVQYHYTLKVRDFTLPVKNSLTTFMDFRYDPKDPKIRRKCYSMLFDYRMSPVSMYINGKLMDSPEKYQFVPHLDDIEYCLSRGQNFFNIWCLTGNKGDFSEEYRKNLAGFINYARPILQKKGVWKDCYIYGFDEIMHRANLKENLAKAYDMCKWIKTALGEDVKICNAGKLMDISPEVMDFWFCAAIPGKKFEKIRQAGKKVGFYWVYGDPSFMLDLPGLAPRVLPWQVCAQGGDGVAYYSTYRPWALNCPPEKIPSGVEWTRDDINIDSFANPKKKSAGRAGRAGDGNLWYPARDGSIIPSIRILNFRDGMEDSEYFTLLKKLDPQNALLAIPEEIVGLTHGVYTHKPEVLEAYRNKIADAVEQAVQKQ